MKVSKLVCPSDGRPCPHGGSCEVYRFGFGLPEKVVWRCPRLKQEL